MKDAATIRSMFASVSRRYDLLNHLLSLNQDKRWRKRTVELCNLRGDDAVLDVCCGTADLAIEYSKRLNSSGTVIGTDFCPEMLVIGKEKVATEPSTIKPGLVVADTLQLPFSDDVFDVVSVAFGIRNVSDLQGGIREMVRVAKAGGRVAILEFSLPDNGLLNKAYMLYFTKALPLIGRMVSRSGNDAYTYLPNSVLEFPRGPEMKHMMEECGLAGVSFTEMSFGIVALYIGVKPEK